MKTEPVIKKTQWALRFRKFHAFFMLIIIFTSSCSSFQKAEQYLVLDITGFGIKPNTGENAIFAVQDVVIRDNTFNDPCLTSMYQFCEAIISIYPEIPKLNNKTPFHWNIIIENNVFYPFDYPVLYAKSVENIDFINNKTLLLCRKIR